MLTALIRSRFGPYTKILTNKNCNTVINNFNKNETDNENNGTSTSNIKEIFS